MGDRIIAFFNGFAKAYDMFGGSDIDNKKHIKIESGFENVGKAMMQVIKDADAKTKQNSISQAKQ
ncbi:hypothetical protein V2I28_06140 [Campylobacter sp. CX2-4080-23]|uniref:hypothetical protein n=1 Tax=Campylobacter porcelli TaxID=1660073 RepID=UPI002EBBC7E6|nr:hypothetical protein [Campylobacter sp. CX2-4080-23]